MKKQIGLFTAILFAVSTLMVSCSQEGHEHTFASEWTSDETNHWHAATCEHDVTDSKAEHSFGEWTTTKEATEEAAGSKKRVCKVCKYEQVEEITKLEHTHTYSTEWTSDAENHWYECRCGEKSEKAKHSFGNWTVTKEATEETEGSKKRTCTVCGYTATEAIEKLAHTHTFAEEWSRDESNHWHAATCGHDVTDSKAEHSFGEWSVTKAATEEEAGSKEKSCSVCGYTATEAIEKLAHTHKFATDWTKDETYHWHAATCEHTTEVSGKARHIFGDWIVTKAASCTEKGEKKATCTTCGYEETEVSDKTEHTFSDWIVTKPATKEAKGSKERVCTVCNYKEVVDIAKIPEGFVFVKGTTITGTESWTPSSNVFLSGRSLTIQDLIVSDHEVTRGEYKAVMGSDPSIANAYDKEGNKLEGDAVLNNPVNYVKWYDALVYCNKLSIKEKLTPCYSINDSTDPDDWGEVPASSNSTWNAATCNFEADGYRLPTEAEWEWLARGGENYTYAGSNTVGYVAWYTSNTKGTREVKTKAPNGYGLYDMSGNVIEWCWDWYGRISASTAADGAASGYNRVLRGGSWYSNVNVCQVADRDCYYPYNRVLYFGFRVVRASSN
ncbi:MAG: formylglycine-generating enzyme family protein [Treponema sp.]|nr:formylglycine-generating enzyme family protein [Spirochaetales bacterium]MDY6191033.1 formylglycine-generating enzyme family protein [Treponema sp.]